MAPIIVLHCLLCCSAFQMGDSQITSSFDIILMKSWNRREERHALDKIGDHDPGLFGSLPTSKLLSGTNAISISFAVCYSTQLLKLCWWVMASWRWATTLKIELEVSIRIFRATGKSITKKARISMWSSPWLSLFFNFWFKAFSSMLSSALASPTLQQVRMTLEFLGSLFGEVKEENIQDYFWDTILFEILYLHYL